MTRNPEEALEQASDEKSMREAVLKLRDEQRQVIMLRFVEEMDYREVADIIGKSVPAVRVIQHRALGNLRKIMMAQVQGHQIPRQSAETRRGQVLAGR